MKNHLLNGKAVGICQKISPEGFKVRCECDFELRWREDPCPVEGQWIYFEDKSL